MNAYEIHNPSFNDMTLTVQIARGLNDWAVEGASGHLYFGRTAAEAMAVARSHGMTGSDEDYDQSQVYEDE